MVRMRRSTTRSIGHPVDTSCLPACSGYCGWVSDSCAVQSLSVQAFLRLEPQSWRPEIKSRSATDGVHSPWRCRKGQARNLRMALNFPYR